MKKIFLITFCFLSVVSFSQELDTVKVTTNQIEEVVKLVEQKDNDAVLVTAILGDATKKTLKETSPRVAEASSEIIPRLLNEEFMERSFRDDFFNYNRLFI